MIAFVLHTMDKYPYKVLWSVWYERFLKYWDLKLPIMYYFLTEDMHVDYEPFVCIRTGFGQWSDRLIRGLSEIDADYIFYMQEDMLMKETIYFPHVWRLFDKYKMNRLGVHELSPHFSCHHIEQNLWKYNDDSEFIQSHQPSLWKKEFLLNNLKSDQDPWQNEIIQSEVLKNTDHRCYLYIENWYDEVSIGGKLNWELINNNYDCKR